MSDGSHFYSCHVSDAPYAYAFRYGNVDMENLTLDVSSGDWRISFHGSCAQLKELAELMLRALPAERAS